MNKITKNKYVGNYILGFKRISKRQIKKAFKSRNAIKLKKFLMDLYNKLNINVVYADTDNCILGDKK